VHTLYGGLGAVDSKTARRPVEELRHTVGLVIVAAVWKSHQLMLEGRKPSGFFRETDHAAFDFGALSGKAALLVELWLIGTGAAKLLPELGKERIPHPGYFDYDVIGPPLSLELPRHSQQGGVIPHGRQRRRLGTPFPRQLR
jgi:hypothetical protein